MPSMLRCWRCFNGRGAVPCEELPRNRRSDERRWQTTAAAGKCPRRAAIEWNPAQSWTESRLSQTAALFVRGA